MTTNEIELQLLNISIQLSQLRQQGLQSRLHMLRLSYADAGQPMPNVQSIYAEQDKVIKAVRAKPYCHTIATDALDSFEALIERL